jgi:hypothetical protein
VTTFLIEPSTDYSVLELLNKLYTILGKRCWQKQLMYQPPSKKQEECLKGSAMQCMVRS